MPENVPQPETDEQLRRVYGENVVISHVGKFTLIHLDNPTPEAVATREAEFEPDDYFFDTCPLCVQARDQGGHIVFDAESERRDDEIPEPGDVASDLS
jgi:hypothetical protein